MSAIAPPPPPYMLNERPTPAHGGSGAPSFRQVPFVRVAERVASGVKARQQLRKYLKAASATQHLVAQMHLTDASIPAAQSQEIQQSCFADFFTKLNKYNQIVGKKHVEAGRAFLEMSRPLEKAKKTQKWGRDSYNLVQKCVQDVINAEKRMEKARHRRNAAHRDYTHWNRVLHANEATFNISPNHPDVTRAYQSAQDKFAAASQEQTNADADFADASQALYYALKRRDDVAAESTELSQSVEEDRLDAMLIVARNFVETKVAILQEEIAALGDLQRLIEGMDRDSVVQQYVLDSLQPDATHKHSRALAILQEHRYRMNKEEKDDGMMLSDGDLSKLKHAGLGGNDLNVIRDFIGSCFDAPAPELVGNGGGHRNRFYQDTNAALKLYRQPVVRSAVVGLLNHQRTCSQVVSSQGFDQLAAALWLLLDACYEASDFRTARSVLNMAQTFFCQTKKKEYLVSVLSAHPMWSSQEIWTLSLRESVFDELEKDPSNQSSAWYALSGSERMQKVVQVHQIVQAQIAAMVQNLAAVKFTPAQVQQYVQNACFAYELGEDQRMALLTSVQSLLSDGRTMSARKLVKKWKPAEGVKEEGGPVQFTTFPVPEFDAEKDSRDEDASVPRMNRESSGITKFMVGSRDPFASSRSTSASFAPSDARELESESSDDDAGWEDLFGVTSKPSTKKRETTLLKAHSTANLPVPDTSRKAPASFSSHHEPKSIEDVSARRKRDKKTRSKAKSTTQLTMSQLELPEPTPFEQLETEQSNRRRERPKSRKGSGTDQILSMAAQMKHRREQHSSGDISYGERVEEAKENVEPAVSGVAALRARFEKK